MARYAQSGFLTISRPDLGIEERRAFDALEQQSKNTLREVLSQSAETMDLVRECAKHELQTLAS